MYRWREFFHQVQSHYIYLKNYFPSVPELSEQNKHCKKKKKKAEREEGGIVDAISGTWLVGKELEFYRSCFKALVRRIAEWFGLVNGPGQPIFIWPMCK